jgi:hypothetical protein
MDADSRPQKPWAGAIAGLVDADSDPRLFSE